MCVRECAEWVRECVVCVVCAIECAVCVRECVVCVREYYYLVCLGWCVRECVVCVMQAVIVCLRVFYINSKEIDLILFTLL